MGKLTEPARRHRRVHEVVQDRQEPAEVGQISAKKSAKEGANAPLALFLVVFQKNNLILSQSVKMNYVFLGCKIGNSFYAILHQTNPSKPNTSFK